MDTLEQKLHDEIGSFFPSETSEYLDAPAVQEAHDNLKVKTEEYYNLRKEHNGDPGDDLGIARLRDEIVGLQGRLIEAIAQEKERRAEPPPGRPAGRRGAKLPGVKLPAMGEAALSKIALGASGVAIGVAIALGYLNHQSQDESRRDTEKRLGTRIDSAVAKLIQQSVAENGQRTESQIQALAADRQASEKKMQDRLDAMEGQIRDLKEQIGKVTSAGGGAKKKAKRR